MEKKLSAFDRLMMALTFAEANEHETAKQILHRNQRSCRPPENRGDGSASPLQADCGFQDPRKEQA